MKNTIVYMGTPRYAEAILSTLIDAEDMDVALVITQPDRPVGRKKVMTPPPVKVLAEKHAIDVLQPERLKDEGVAAAIEAVNPDFIIVAAFGQLLPPLILDRAPCINLHASLLPQYRGASPVQQSLLHGDSVTGVTSMWMDVGLDTGDILERVTRDIPPHMRLHALMEQLTHDACALTLHTIRNFETIPAQKQDDTQATYCKKIRKGDGEVDGSDARELYSKYRAFEGWPGVFASGGTKLEGISLLDEEGEHGAFEILSFEGESVRMGCGRGSLMVATLQPPGKKPMRAKAYCVGRGLGVGHTLF